MWTSLEPATTTVDPGSGASVRLRVRNTGDTVEEYRLQVVGAAAGWSRVEPDVLRLYPGAEGTAQVEFAPPRTPDALAGPTPFGVRVQPREAPQTTDVVEGQITVGPFAELRTELVPLVVRGRWSAKGALAVDNLGNQPLTASFSGRENGEELEVEAEPGSVQVAPGRAAFADLRLKPGAVSWVGGTKKHPFTVSVLRPGVPDPTELRGTYIQPSVLPRWAMAVLSLLVALVVAAVVIWFQHKPQMSSQATEKPGKQQQLPQGGMSPAPSPTPAAPKTEPSETPAKKPPKEEPKPDPKPGGEEKPKPPAPKPQIVRAHANNFSPTDSMFLDVANGQKETGTTVTTHTWSDGKAGKNQWWTVHRYDDKTIALEPGNAPGTVLDKNMDSNLVTIWGQDPAKIASGQLPDNQRWRLEDAGEGYFLIVNVATGTCLMAPGHDKPNEVAGCFQKGDGNRVFQEWKIADRP